MALIDKRTRDEVARRLSKLQRPVQLTLNIDGSLSPGAVACVTCSEARELVTTIAEQVPEKVLLDVREAATDSGIEGLPWVTVAPAGESARIAFQGLTSGFEFASLIDAIERAGGAGPGFGEQVQHRLDAVGGDIQITVFVTPSCPYCPSAASLANRMALASPRVQARTVEANEFPELSLRFGVRGVPHTLVNGERSFVGALPEVSFVEKVLDLAGASGRAA